eukprot:gene30550-biopygen16391
MTVWSKRNTQSLGSWTSLASRRELTGSFAPSRKRLADHLSLHVSTERHSSGAYIDTTNSRDIINHIQHIRARHALMDSLHIPLAAIHSRDWTVAEVLQPYLTALKTSEVHRTLRLDTPLRGTVQCFTWPHGPSSSPVLGTSTVPSDYLNYLLVLPPTATSLFSIRSYPRDYRNTDQPPTWAPDETPCRVNSSTALNNVMQYRNILSAAVEHILSHQPNHPAAGDNPRHDPHPAFCTALLISAAALVTTWVHLHPPRVPCTVPTRYIRSSPTGHNLDGRRENLLTTHHLTPTDDHNLLASSSRWRQVIQPRTKRYLTDMAASYPVNRENSRFASLVVRAVHNHTVLMFNPLSETDTPTQNMASYREHVAAGDGQVPPFEGPPTHPTESIIWNKSGQTAPIDLMMDILRFFPHLRRHTPFSMSSIRFSHPHWSAFYVTLLMHMVTHAHSMESYSYETNSDNTLYLGDVNLLHRCIQDLPAQDNFSSVLTWGKEQGLPIRVTLTPRSMGEVLDPRSMEHSGASLHLSHPLVTPCDPIRPLTDASVCILPSIQGTYSLYSNPYPYLDSCYTSTRHYQPVQGFGLPLDALHSTSIFLIRRPPIYNSEDDFDTPSPTSSTPAGDNYEEPQDFFTTQLDNVYWQPGQEFPEGQAAVYQASTCAFPVHLDPPTPASLLPGRLQGGLTTCLSHMDPNYLQEGGINNSMPDGAVTPNADRGALHPDCDLFIGHHRDGTEAQRKEMAAMLNRMTPAVARTMEDLREGYKGIVPPMHIEKDNDKQAFTSPYRKPPIEKLAQDKPLLWMFSSANVTGAITRWACMLQSFDFDIMHRPGAQHGNADALSRFPSPTAEDNTGARIDLDSDLYAAFPTVPTTPYVPLDLTLGHIVDYVLDVRSVLSICTTPLPAAVTYMAQNGITLYEMCGGMCAGLEAALRNGIQVNSPPLAPGRQLDTDLRLAAMSKDTDGLDIHSDQFVLEYLRRGALGSNWTTSRTRRVLARSRKYRLGASPTGEERIIRILANGIERIVPAPSQRGNTMLMHAVEYFSAALVVVPIPAKEAIHTVCAHSHGVLAHFGAYALCISDNGPEFQGKFKEHLLHNFIDHRTIHPNHPQGNGFVERSVGTIKAALTKICSENLAFDTWDIDIAKVVTAHNCSPQETTKCAPFTLLSRRGLVLPNCKASGITAIPAGRIQKHHRRNLTFSPPRRLAPETEPPSPATRCLSSNKSESKAASTKLSGALPPSKDHCPGHVKSVDPAPSPEEAELAAAAYRFRRPFNSKNFIGETDSDIDSDDLPELISEEVYQQRLADRAKGFQPQGLSEYQQVGDPPDTTSSLPQHMDTLTLQQARAEVELLSDQIRTNYENMMAP